MGSGFWRYCAGVVGLLAVAVAIMPGNGCARGVEPRAVLAADPPKDGTEAAQFRGVFVATAYNLDWPSRPGMHWRVQRDEIRAIVQRVRDMKCNVIILQVRAFGDRIHRPTTMKAEDPWAASLNNTNDPEDVKEVPENKRFDPLRAWIEECHDPKKGQRIDLHAWINPFRVNRIVRYKGRTLPTVLKADGKHLYLDHRSPDVQDYAMDVIEELMKYPDVEPGERGEAQQASALLLSGGNRNGKVDALLFDHNLTDPPDRGPTTNPSTQPSGAAPSAQAVQAAAVLETENKRTRAQWLHDQTPPIPPGSIVNSMDDFIKRVSVAARRHGVKVGISPRAELGRSGDTMKWLKEGHLDYVIPEFYREFTDDLETTLRGWLSAADEGGKAPWREGVVPTVVAGFDTAIVQAPEPRSPMMPWEPKEIEDRIQKARNVGSGRPIEKPRIGHAYFTWSSLREAEHAGPESGRNIGRRLKDNHHPGNPLPFKPKQQQGP